MLMYHCTRPILFMCSKQTKKKLKRSETKNVLNISWTIIVPIKLKFPRPISHFFYQADVVVLDGETDHAIILFLLFSQSLPQQTQGGVVMVFVMFW